MNRSIPPYRRSQGGMSAADPRDPMQAMPSGELLPLADLAEPEAIRRLSAVGARFGKVRSVVLLPKLADSGRNRATFLLNFEAGLDASRAALSLNCPLYGYTTVIVSVPQLPSGPEGTSRQSPTLLKNAHP